MPELTITASQVIAANANTAKAYGTAGTAITAGQAVYLDSNNFIQPARANNQVQAQGLVGIALDSAAGSAQPLAYAVSGDVTLGAGSVMVAGSVYVVSTGVAGGIVSANDPVAGTATFISILGVATTTSNLRLGIQPLGGPK